MRRRRECRFITVCGNVRAWPAERRVYVHRFEEVSKLLPGTAMVYRAMTGLCTMYTVGVKWSRWGRKAHTAQTG